MRMSTVREVLQAKGSDVWSVSPDELVYDALEMMAKKDVGALLVLEDGHLLGIFSERDYARKVILAGKSSRREPVRELMSRQLVFVPPTETVDTCMKLMTVRRVRHLPVLDGKRLVGVVTIGDVVKQLISDQEFTIEQLEKYIAASW